MNRRRKSPGTLQAAGVLNREGLSGTSIEMLSPQHTGTFQKNPLYDPTMSSFNVGLGKDAPRMSMDISSASHSSNIVGAEGIAGSRNVRSEATTRTTASSLNRTKTPTESASRTHRSEVQSSLNFTGSMSTIVGPTNTINADSATANLTGMSAFTMSGVTQPSATENSLRFMNLTSVSAMQTQKSTSNGRNDTLDLIAVAGRSGAASSNGEGSLFTNVPSLYPSSGTSGSTKKSAATATGGSGGMTSMDFIANMTRPIPEDEDQNDVWMLRWILLPIESSWLNIYSLLFIWRRLDFLPICPLLQFCCARFYKVPVLLRSKYTVLPFFPNKDTPLFLLRPCGIY